MTTISIIKKSQLEGTRRLDAEYYQPEYLALNLKLVSQESKRLGEIAAKVTCGPFGSAILETDYTDRGVPLIRVADLNNWFVKEGDLVYIDDILSKRMQRYQVVDGDIVVSQRGTIAMFSRVTDKFPKWNISANLISIKKSQGINFDYLLVFLNCHYGISQLYRRLSGQVQSKITTDDVKEILVAVPISKKQEEISALLQTARDREENSHRLYQQAENLLLLEDLCLEDFKPSHDLTFVVNFSDTESANRLDADHFQPKYEQLVSRLKSINAKPLNEVIESAPARFSPLAKPSDTFRYVELADINSSIGIIDNFTEVTGKEAPSRAKRVLKTGDVIISSVEGSLEKAALVDREQEGYLASTGFFQLRSEKIFPEVLLVLAKSFVMQMQLQRQAAGTILSAVPKEAINSFLIPFLPGEIQQKIADLVHQSHEARKKSKQLLDEAKRKVEEMIEKRERH